MTTWLLLVPIAPLLAAGGVLAFGRRLPRGGGWMATGILALSTAGLGVLGGSGTLQAEAVWLSAGRFELRTGLWLNGLSWWTALLVASVCLLVTLYAVAYMREEAGLPRFFALMAFFAGAMLTLVLSSSLVLLFMAWEGVGLASFGLIGFWYDQPGSRRAAQKAFLMTRLGDFGLLLGWLLVLLLLGSTSIEALHAAAHGGQIAAPTLTLLALLFFAAAVGKSAQLPLTAWLPDAMAGPTPVSALLHSATMAAAGVYLVLRLFPVLEQGPHALTVVLWTGAATALAAALVATAQHDLKRILAWSTVSQLGEMMMALGLGGPLAAGFHLTTHAVFKSTLFLCAGALDHAAGSRDLRELGGLWNVMPITAGVFGASALALAGFPPFAGFWSEEKILGAAQAHGTGWGLLMLVLIFLAGVYIGRAGWAAFGNWPDAPSPEGRRPTAVMLAPMLLLGLGAVAMGYVLTSPVEHVIGFSAAKHTLGLWRWAAIAASAVGLAIGALRVRTAGPAPVLGGWPKRVVSFTNRLARVPSRAAMRVASATNPLERGLDAGASELGQGALGAGNGAQRAEGGLDAGTRWFGAATMRTADATDAAERTGFGRGLDAAAYALRRAGRRLRALQTGQLPQYTFSLVVWVLLATAIVLALWL